MAQILKLPFQPTKLGYRRVRKRRAAEDSSQLDLFTEAGAKIVQFVPSNLGLFEQALLWDERGHPQAAELYERAIEGQDCVADALCNLGIIETRNGNTARAFDCFTTSLKHDPRHCEAHYNIGNLYFEANDLELARFHYQVVTEIDPAFANAYFNLALVQSVNNEPAAAIHALTKYQALVSDDEARTASELLLDLKKNAAAAKMQ